MRGFSSNGDRRESFRWLEIASCSFWKLDGCSENLLPVNAELK